MNDNNHRIAYAFYKEEWVYGRDDNGVLAQEGIQVTPEEFDPDMKGKIFCPICFTPLSRSPNIASVTTNSRVAHFKHKPTYSEIPCVLKTKKKEGLLYENEEEALKAIENESLVIVHDWMNEPPLIDDNTDKNREFNQTTIEDERRHIGRESVGRYILFYSSLGWEQKNIPRCFINKWGQYGLLPQNYEKYLLKYKQKLI